eukprot:4726443-Amphidinium_carterae.1
MQTRSTTTRTSCRATNRGYYEQHIDDTHVKEWRNIEIPTTIAHSHQNKQETVSIIDKSENRNFETSRQLHIQYNRASQLKAGEDLGSYQNLVFPKGEIRARPPTRLFHIP